MNPRFFSRVFYATSTAVLIAGPVIVFLLIGLWLDSIFNTSPFIALVFGLAGFAGSIMSLMKLLKTIK